MSLNTRKTNFSFNVRLSRHEDDWLYFGIGEDKTRALKIHWTSEIISREGAHYHCWISSGLSKKEKSALLKQFKHCCRLKGDPVKLSWDYLPYSVDPNPSFERSDRVKRANYIVKRNNFN